MWEEAKCPAGFAGDNDGNCIQLEGDADTDTDADAPQIVDVDGYCDGSASSVDWLVVISAQTDIRAYDVTCTIEQYGDNYGSWSLFDEGGGRDGYGEIREDDLGIDCEGPNGYIDCYAE